MRALARFSARASVAAVSTFTSSAAAACSDGVLRVFDLQRCATPPAHAPPSSSAPVACRTHAHAHPLVCCSALPNGGGGGGGLVAVGDAGGEVCVWSARCPHSVHALRVPAPATAVAWCGDGDGGGGGGDGAPRLLLTAGGGGGSGASSAASVQLWDLRCTRHPMCASVAYADEDGVPPPPPIRAHLYAPQPSPPRAAGAAMWARVHTSRRDGDGDGDDGSEQAEPSASSPASEAPPSSGAHTERPCVLRSFACSRTDGAPVFDAATGAFRARFTGHGTSTVVGLAFLPPGWAVAAPHRRHFGESSGAWCGAAAPHVLTSDDGCRHRLWRADTGGGVTSWDHGAWLGNGVRRAQHTQTRQSLPSPPPSVCGRLLLAASHIGATAGWRVGVWDLAAPPVEGGPGGGIAGRSAACDWRGAGGGGGGGWRGGGAPPPVPVTSLSLGACGGGGMCAAAGDAAGGLVVRCA